MASRRWKSLALNLVLLLVVLIEIYPFLMMFFGSFKSAEELSANPGGWPLQPSLVNYMKLFHYSGGLVTRTFMNSVFVSVCYVMAVVILSSMAAFAFAKYEFKGRKLFFIALLATMMVPVELLIPSLYIIFSRMRWLNTYYVQIFPHAANVFSMFMIRQYMLSIPDSLLESARIDGAGHWRVFSRIALPMSAPIIGAVTILQFLVKWNEYLWPAIMVSDPKYLPIMTIIPTLSEDGDIFSISWELVLAGCVVATLPILAVFAAFQKKIMASVAAGAVKE